MWSSVGLRCRCRTSSSLDLVRRCLSGGDEPAKPSLYGRLKSMYRDYWYVVVPVHVATSACWYGGFYYAAKSGVDVVALLESCGVPDRFTHPLRDSPMGYFALAYALYKLATPVRYAATLGATTLSIERLRRWGYIKPLPSKDRLQQMYHDTKHELRQRKNNVIDDIAKYKHEMAAHTKKGESSTK